MVTIMDKEETFCEKVTSSDKLNPDSDVFTFISGPDKRGSITVHVTFVCCI